MRPAVFLKTVVGPVVRQLGAGGAGAQELLLGTAVHESGCFRYRRQIGGGPALGYFQMEPSTHDDIWANFLAYRPTLAAKVDRYLGANPVDRYRALERNDRYGAAMARVHYMRVSAPLPAAGNIMAQARYWKRHYNTPLGAGTPRGYVHSWRRCVQGARP